MSRPSASILKLRRYYYSVDLRQSISQVQARTGKGAVRQIFELLGHRFGRHKIPAEEYYEFGLWRPTLSASERAAFVSSSESTALNLRLSPVDRLGLHGFTTNKVLTGLAMRSAGLPMQKPCALFGLAITIPGAANLSTASDISRWLRQDGSLPVFGKPLHKSLCIGAASYMSLADQGKSVVLGDGRSVDTDRLAAEIAANFPKGYLFEPLIRQHPDVVAMTGPAVGALRVLTLREPDGVRVLYLAQRLPAVGAMTDGAQLSVPFSEALIDAESGRIVRVQSMDQIPPDRLLVSNTTGKAFADVVLPYVKEAQTIACEAHRLLVGAGILGFDIALSETGPVINEINSNPYHSIYQRSADRGLLNPEFKPRIEAALTLARAGRR